MKIANLPRSFEEVKRVVTKFQAAVPSIFENPTPSPQKAAGGTRGGIAQGTSSAGNTPNPLGSGQSNTPGMALGWDDVMETPPEAIFSTNAPAYDGAEGTIVQTAGWPANPSRTEIGNAPADRAEQAPYSGSLHLGPPPGRITRYLPECVFGSANGMNSGMLAGPGFPWNGDLGHINHVPIARQALGTKGPQKLSDDNAAIPAVYAGNPRP
jgi:hypothetical protein